MSASPIPIFLLAALVGGISCFELAGLGGGPRRFWPVLAAAVAIGYSALGLKSPGWMPEAQLFGLTLLGAIIAPLWIREKRRILLEVGSLWCVSPLFSIAILHQIYSPPGAQWNLKTPLFLLLVPLWIGDTLAYVVGRSIGKHLLASAISPKKTVEGAVANVVGCVGGALLVGGMLNLAPWISVSCGLIAGVLGQAGDLFESALKRTAGTKDSGDLLPGHGGVLDRIDSMLLAAPAQALLLSVVLPPTFSR